MWIYSVNIGDIKFTCLFSFSFFFGENKIHLFVDEVGKARNLGVWYVTLKVI